MIATLLVTAALAAAPDLDAAAAKIEPKVIAWRRDFHAHPELGNHETRTAGIVAKELEALGLEVTTGVAVTGVTARLKGGKPGPRLVLRADMDALPVTEQVDLPFASKAKAPFNGETVGVMHACGHDAHTAILLGVATLLAPRRAELPGEILFVFQPAEEGPPIGAKGGAALMLEEGLFEKFKPDAALGLHVWSALSAGTIGYHAGPFMATSDRFTIEVTGRQTHGAKPWAGVDPVVAAASIIVDAQTIVSRETDLTAEPLVVSFGLLRAGVRYNIIPERVQLEGTVRSFGEDVRARTLKRLEEIATHVAAAHGASAKFADERHTPVTVNDRALTAQLAPVLERAAGAGKAFEIPVTTVAEDFGEFAKLVPSLYFFVGSTPAGVDPASAPANHSPKFFLDEAALAVGVRALAAAAIEVLEHPPRK
jgi:amidohydrolase